MKLTATCKKSVDLGIIGGIDYCQSFIRQAKPYLYHQDYPEEGQILPPAPKLILNQDPEPDVYSVTAQYWDDGAAPDPRWLWLEAFTAGWKAYGYCLREP